MRDQYSLALRIISIVVLSFFTWTFGGVFDIAYAMENSSQTSPNGQQHVSKADQQTKKEIRPEEKFGKDMVDIESILKDDKSDHETKKSRIRSKKAEIDADDVEIKKQFRATEDKIKSLPEVIKKRHKDFVEKYDDNLRELRTNLDDIDKARSDNEKNLAQRKAREFVEKVKPPKKHQALDPNKLPHRTEEPVFKEPRTRPAEFQRDSDQQLAFSNQFNRQSARPVLVASNGSLSGLLSPDSQFTNNDSRFTALRDFPEGSYQIALANPPTSADLAETIEVQFTPGITAKAAELEHNPVKIYNWVRNNIEYVPTYGSIQGANMCLQTKLCNDFDTASLLIALLRASGIHARYVYGTIELPIEKVKNWVGGFTDSMESLRLLASAGVPTKGLVDGGVIKYARVEHVWVESFIDYFPSRGARHKNGKGSTWIPLDASFKQYTFTQGLDIKTAVPFDAQPFIDQITSTATINEPAGYVTGVNSALIQQGMQDYQTRVQNYISQHYPNATVGDVIGKKDIVKQEFPYLLGTLPYKTTVVGARYSTVPDNLRHKLSFSVIKDMFDSDFGTPINITKGLPELAGKKITLSYSPATASDEAVINSYLSKPHIDGTPIQPNELPSSLPAYLINLTPKLRLDGRVLATGSPVSMGETETFVMTFSGPGLNANDVITNDIQAGEYLGIGLDLGRVSQEQMTALQTKLEATKTKLQANEFSDLGKDDILGDFLYTTAISYYAELDAMDFVTAKTMGVAAIRLPSENIFSFEAKVNKLFGVPLSVWSGGLAMDVDRTMALVKAFDGNRDKPVQFMLMSGMNSSVLEHSVPEQLIATADEPAHGISAVKALQIANDQSIPIYTMNQSNIGSILPQLQLDSNTIADIQNAVAIGKTVTVSKTDVAFNGWTGCGYIIVDPDTGAGAYMISGGLSGAQIIGGFIGSFFSGLLTGLADKYQNPNAMFGDLVKINNAKWIRGFAKFSLTANIINNILNIISKPNLNWAQTTAAIFLTVGISLGEFWLGAAAAAMFVGPCGIVAAVAVSIVAAVVLNFLTNLFLELLAFRVDFRGRTAFQKERIYYEIRC